MTGNEYQKEALRTECPTRSIRNVMAMKHDWASSVRLLEGLIGLSGEAGEAIDILKKCMFQGHDLDGEREHLAKELGDVMWYLALSADAIGYSLDEILEMNVAKLRERYPNGFEASRSRNRAIADV